MAILGCTTDEAPFYTKHAVALHALIELSAAIDAVLYLR